MYVVKGEEKRRLTRRQGLIEELERIGNK